MKIEFERKIRKIAGERLINIPEEIREFEPGDKVKISIAENGILVQKKDP